jgi:hypothetical protein
MGPDRRNLGSAGGRRLERVTLLAAAVALRVGAGNDLGNLLGDGGLARPVHLRRDKGDVRKSAIRTCAAEIKIETTEATSHENSRNG